jgi:hypothetical protein
LSWKYNAAKSFPRHALAPPRSRLGSTLVLAVLFSFFLFSVAARLLLVAPRAGLLMNIGEVTLRSGGQGIRILGFRNKPDGTMGDAERCGKISKVPLETRRHE